MVGGQQEVFEKVRPLVEAMGKSITLIGGSGGDYMVGNEGADVFVFQDVTDSQHFWLIAEWSDIEEHARIRKNDTVVVIAGADKGRKGKVIEVRPGEGADCRVVVEGVSLVLTYRSEFDIVV